MKYRSLRICLYLISLCFSFVGSPVVAAASQCKEMKLILTKVTVEPSPELTRIASENGKAWFVQRTRPQKPAEVNYDTTVTVRTSSSKFFQILIEGHSRSFGVETAWKSDDQLALQVEWGHALTCRYVVDTKTQKWQLAK